jgi:hypothetical protein
VQHSRAAFDQGSFISPLFSNAKQPRGHKTIKPLFQQKAAIRARLDCTRATQPYGFRQRRPKLFHRFFSTQNIREVTTNKAALSTKMPRSVPGFIVRVQHSRTAFDKGGFILTLPLHTKQPRGHKKIKPLFQQKSRDPCQA